MVRPSIRMGEIASPFLIRLATSRAAWARRWATGT